MMFKSLDLTRLKSLLPTVKTLLFKYGAATAFVFTVNFYGLEQSNMCTKSKIILLQSDEIYRPENPYLLHAVYLPEELGEGLGNMLLDTRLSWDGGRRREPFGIIKLASEGGIPQSPNGIDEGNYLRDYKEYEMYDSSVFVTGAIENVVPTAVYYQIIERVEE